MATTDSSALVFEPDNHQMYPFALHAKWRLRGGYYPVLEPDDEAPDLQRLWTAAFGGQGIGLSRPQWVRRQASTALMRLRTGHSIRRAFTDPPPSWRLRLAETLAVPERPREPAQNLISKSVYSAFCLEWLTARTGAQVVVLLRDIRSVVSSWSELGWLAAGADGKDELACTDMGLLQERARAMGGPALDAGAPPISRVTWLLAVLELAMLRAAREHDWMVVRHEDLVQPRSDVVRDAIAGVGLTWTEATETALRSSRKPGAGFETSREPAQLVEVWKRRLTDSQIADVETVLGGFPAAVR